MAQCVKIWPSPWGSAFDPGLVCTYTSNLWRKNGTVKCPPLRTSVVPCQYHSPPALHTHSSITVAIYIYIHIYTHIYIPGAFPGGKGGRCVRLTTYHHPVSSRNLGTLTSWNTLGHSRPVTGLIYLYIYIYIYQQLNVPSKNTGLLTTCNDIWLCFLITPIGDKGRRKVTNLLKSRHCVWWSHIDISNFSIPLPFQPQWDIHVPLVLKLRKRGVLPTGFMFRITYSLNKLRLFP